MRSMFKTGRNIECDLVDFHTIVYRWMEYKIRSVKFRSKPVSIIQSVNVYLSIKYY